MNHPCLALRYAQIEFTSEAGRRMVGFFVGMGSLKHKKCNIRRMHYYIYSVHIYIYVYLYRNVYTLLIMGDNGTDI